MYPYMGISPHGNFGISGNSTVSVLWDISGKILKNREKRLFFGAKIGTFYARVNSAKEVLCTEGLVVIGTRM